MSDLDSGVTGTDDLMENGKCRGSMDHDFMLIVQFYFHSTIWIKRVGARALDKHFVDQ